MTPEAAGAFVGRALEREAIARAARQAAAGAGSVVLVAGEPGVGKTRLVEEATGRHDGTVLWATCRQDDAPPFWPWVQVLRGCVDGTTNWPSGERVPASVGSLLAGTADTSTATDPSSRYRFFEDVTNVLATASAAAALVVVLDDLQWADEGSIRLLRFVAGEVGQLPLLLVATYRDTELVADHALVRAMDDLVRTGLHLTLGGLEPQDLMALVRSVTTLDLAIDEPFAERLHVRTGGNPFFARELTRLLQAEGRLGQGATPELTAAPGGVRAVVARRVARLPQPTADLLSWAALVGTTFDAAVLAAATSRDPVGVLAELDPAVTARLIAEVDAGTFRFVHDLVRETVAASMGIGEKAARHRALGGALANTAGHDAERTARVAAHLVAGVGGGEVAEAVTWAVRAAEQARAALAYEDAARWYERAIATRRAAGGDGRDTADLLLELGGARVDAGDLPAARDAFVAAATVARSHGDAEQLAAAALGLGGGSGGFEVSLFDQVQIDLLDEALAALPERDSSLRARVLARLSVALAFVESTERRAQVSDAAIAMARRVGDEVALGHALAAWCDAFSGPDDVEQRLDAAEEVIRIAVASRRRELELLGRRLRVVALMEQGRLADVGVEVAAFARVAEALRQPLYRWYAPLWRATLAMAVGDFAGAARWTDEAERVGAMAHSENATILVAVQRIVRLRHEGRFDLAADVAQQLLGGVSEATAPGALEGAFLVGDVLAGELDRARHRADRLATEGLPSSRADSEWMANAAQLAEASVALGHRGLAAAVFEALVPYPERFVVEGIGAAVCGAVAHYLALCSAVLGRDREAERFVARAEELHRSAGIFVRPPALCETNPNARDGADLPAVMRFEGGFWEITYLGRTVRVRDSKGLRDLASLLRAPGTAVHVSELTGAPSASGAPALDRAAVSAYRRRLAEIDEDLAIADAHNDISRSEKLAVERDFLVAELAGGLGLGGRARRPGDPVERARKAVTARVRDSIGRIADLHPQLGRHLENAVRTGTWCSYRPEQPIRWSS